MAGTVSTACGKTAVTGKIIGGKNTVDKRWPWQAGLLYQGMFICGASLISDYWVISAAHCFQMYVFPTACCWVGWGGSTDGQDRRG